MVYLKYFYLVFQPAWVVPIHELFRINLPDTTDPIFLLNWLPHNLVKSKGDFKSSDDDRIWEMRNPTPTLLPK